MTDSNGYLSKDRGHINQGQQSRRARNPRIDYYPSRDALAVIEAKRGRYLPWNNNSGILDAIVIQWASLTGIKYREVSKPMSSAARPELSNHYAHANDSGAGVREGTPARSTDSGITARIAQARAREMTSAALRATQRVTCGAKCRTGKPCQGNSLPGKRRCKWHGGCSTGPKTAEGKAKSLANLRQNRAISRNSVILVESGKLNVF